MQKRKRWKQGNGTTLSGLFVMILCTSICLFFAQTFILQQEAQASQTAADSISDATAVYASNEGATYDEATEYAKDVQRLVKTATGTKTTDLKLDKTLYEDEQKVDVHLNVNGKYTDPLYNLNSREWKKNNNRTTTYKVPGKAQTEFTGVSTDYVQWMINIANDDSHGYDQNHRNLNPDIDCSSFVYYALKNAGYNVGNFAFSTAIMEGPLINAGFQKLPYLRATLKEGDILWRAGHTEVYIGDNMTVGAHIAENGKTIASIPGDQTGHEVDVGPLLGQWTFIYRK